MLIGGHRGAGGQHDDGALVVTGTGAVGAGPDGGLPLRFGLAGTGFWAARTHAPALAAGDGVALTAVWGRNARAAADLAGQYGSVAHTDFTEFLADVDAVAFSVPPDVQAGLATRAAAAGKHLLLEKPVALSEQAAQALAEAVADAGVASVVFFTGRFSPAIRSWLADAAAQRGWHGASATWLGSALRESSPFNTPWRHRWGALWDLAPHPVALLHACLGPVAAVTADRGAADVTHLVLHHDSGVTSTVTVTLSAPAAAGFDELYLWGEPGRRVLPAAAGEPSDALRLALAELAANARAGRTEHPCDVRLGLHVVRVLADAQRQLDERPAPLASAELGNGLTIRQAGLPDVDTLRVITRTAYQHYVERMGREPAPMTADHAAEVDTGQAWIAEADGAPVGLIVLIPSDDHLLIENVAVLPDFQRRGVGRRLLEFAERQARAASLGQIRLYTHETMTENQAYYLNRGYQVYRRADQDGFRRVHFIKTLAD
jgi:predicted dehydrogenase/GNAT superfamily N-acetyltransferase